MSNAPILIVDDEPLNLDALRHILEQDHRLVVARNGREALAAVAKHKPSLILMDIQMPEMDGYDACLALKADPATEAIPVIFVTSLSETWDEATGFECGAVDYIVKPVSPQVVRARVRTHLSLVRASDLERSYRDAIYMLGRAGHFNDNDTGVHIWRMAAYARELALAAGWHHDDCHNLELAAPMHDTGKMGIPGSILRKPGKLDADEWQVMKTHARIGYEILRGSDAPVFRLAAEVALRHHEKWDGSGYPDGLAGSAIPESARIVAIADVFDALTMRRPYKEPWPMAQVIAHMKQGAGNHFDPALIAHFTAILPRLLAIKAEWDAREAASGGAAAAGAEAARPAERALVLSAKEVIHAHREWKVRFQRAMAQRLRLNVEEIASDQCCPFGKWLGCLGHGRRRPPASHEDCAALHRAFHAEAGRVADLINRGDFRTAARMLAHGSVYAQASDRLVAGVKVLFREVQEGQAVGHEPALARPVAARG
ncbi:response regulator [Parasulfuritortus cantonensis]|uniref:Response regulator n=1 Tax=Parasulfuritortus cantonensis TaxID=2528202 RepID=A0A4R1BIR1_9PROT|nr:HD domain-containing phosphohydrolase [Parasulfuritortus cantonensis]TCJ17183.1 response regulator [Parasulfuritortus cantonensis]